MLTPGARVALVHEWLVGWGGSESVLLSLSRLFPGAPIFTLVHAPGTRVRDAFADREIRTTPLQRLPWIGRWYRATLPLMPAAWRSLDLGAFDLVISSSHAFSKAVRKAPGARHLCYCHTPPRYLWDLNAEYRRGLATSLRGPLLSWLRRQDRDAASGVDEFIANSRFVADRILRIYGRTASVVYPPVDVDELHPAPELAEEGYYLAGGRLVAYKRVDVAIRAANAGRLPLVVFGDGPERRRLEALAGPTVRFVEAGTGASGVGDLLRGCRAYVFPGVEDFGILPVEAQACGRPVVALARGGVLESIVDGVTGILYEEDSEEGLLAGVRKLEARSWDPAVCRVNSLRFARKRFEEEIRGATS
jgi:glycosyltransferase involved in cell wall biosynthesis